MRFIVLGVFLVSSVNAKTYRSLTEALKSPLDVTVLLLKNNNLSAIPKQIALLKNLTILDLSANKLSSLPKEIGKLKNLSKLYLWKNKLTILPKEIGDLQKLTELSLGVNFHGGNQLSELPKEIGKLESLTELVLAENKLSELPNEIWQLKKLKYHCGRSARESNATLAMYARWSDKFRCLLGRSETLSTSNAPFFKKM